MQPANNIQNPTKKTRMSGEPNQVLKQLTMQLVNEVPKIVTNAKTVADVQAALKLQAAMSDDEKYRPIGNVNTSTLRLWCQKIFENKDDYVLQQDQQLFNDPQDVVDNTKPLEQRRRGPRHLLTSEEMTELFDLLESQTHLPLNVHRFRELALLVVAKHRSADLAISKGIAGFQQYSHNWCLTWMRVFGLRRAKPTTSRTISSEEIVAETLGFYEQLRQISRKCRNPALIFNFDEFFSLLQPKVNYVWTRIPSGDPIPVNSGKAGFTGGVVSSAAGEIVELQMLWSGGTARSTAIVDATEFNAETREAWKRVHQQFTGTDSHFQNTETFNEWAEHFAKDVILKMKKDIVWAGSDDESVPLVIYDKAPQHGGAKAIFQKYGVEVLEIPARTTHVSQPNDQYVIPCLRSAADHDRIEQEGSIARGYVFLKEENPELAATATIVQEQMRNSRLNNALKNKKATFAQSLARAAVKVTPATVMKSWWRSGILWVLSDTATPLQYENLPEPYKSRCDVLSHSSKYNKDNEPITNYHFHANKFKESSAYKEQFLIDEEDIVSALDQNAILHESQQLFRQRVIALLKQKDEDQIKALRLDVERGALAQKELNKKLKKKKAEQGDDADGDGGDDAAEGNGASTDPTPSSGYTKKTTEQKALTKHIKKVLAEATQRGAPYEELKEKGGNTIYQVLTGDGKKEDRTLYVQTQAVERYLEEVKSTTKKTLSSSTKKLDDLLLEDGASCEDPFDDPEHEPREKSRLLELFKKKTKTSNPTKSSNNNKTQNNTNNNNNDDDANTGNSNNNNNDYNNNNNNNMMMMMMPQQQQQQPQNSSAPPVPANSAVAHGGKREGAGKHKKDHVTISNTPKITSFFSSKKINQDAAAPSQADAASPEQKQNIPTPKTAPQRRDRALDDDDDESDDGCHEENDDVDAKSNYSVGSDETLSDLSSVDSNDEFYEFESFTCDVVSPSSHPSSFFAPTLHGGTSNNRDALVSTLSSAQCNILLRKLAKTGEYIGEFAPSVVCGILRTVFDNLMINNLKEDGVCVLSPASASPYRIAQRLLPVFQLLQNPLHSSCYLIGIMHVYAGKDGHYVFFKWSRKSKALVISESLPSRQKEAAHTWQSQRVANNYPKAKELADALARYFNDDPYDLSVTFKGYNGDEKPTQEAGDCFFASVNYLVDFLSRHHEKVLPNQHLCNRTAIASRTRAKLCVKEVLSEKEQDDVDFDDVVKVLNKVIFK